MSQEIPQDTPLTATLPLWAWLVVIQHLRRGVYDDVAPTLALILGETNDQYAAAHRAAQMSPAREVLKGVH